MGKAIIRTIVWAVIPSLAGAIMAHGATVKSEAPLVTFASNLFVEPCNPTCNYESNVPGYRVWGPDNCTNPGHTEWFGVAFISSVTGTPTRISAALKLTNAATCPTNQITLSIYTDDCKGPRKRLVSGIATVPATSCALTVAQLHHAPTLTAGTKYWVVTSTTPNNLGFDAIWYGSNNAQVGIYEGESWRQSNGGTPAFMVQGIAASENRTARPNARPVFGSNLLVEPCNTCNYDTNLEGYPVTGPDNCTFLNKTYWLAVPFISEVTGVPKRIFASINLTDPAQCPTDKVTLSIYTDACYPNGPGLPLASAVATVPPEPCRLAVATLRNPPTLDKGTKYWVVATSSEQQSALDAIWYPSNNAQMAYNIGFGGWTQFSGLTPGFAVQ